MKNLNKKKYWFAGIAIIIFAAILTFYFVQKEQERKREEARIAVNLVAMGDSLTEGSGDEKDNGGYVGIIASMLSKREDVRSVKTENYGVGGNRIDQLMKRLDTQPDFQKDVKAANAISITIGGNDVMKVVRSKLLDAEKQDFTKASKIFDQKLKELLAEIRDLNADAPIYVFGIYNPYTTYFADFEVFDEIIAEWNAATKKTLAKTDDAHFISVTKQLEERGDTAVGKANPNLAGDLFHPNHEGYQKMADALYKEMVTSIHEGNIR
ncbi:lysophospholipase L1-like esterase [Listeria rocourtiae]|uniref:Lysophospholipase L1-like esterase n=1 Tax=Listeria rocourtiae TaxID=647910 RepID=A0A4R6ZRG1_9LIST|nr:SGNH/GDSL hydrolase family protein [Listeria rocourtiae]TDR55250.1 lysophospholipase L1-like esterase [Listeria rocourtiae]